MATLLGSHVIETNKKNILAFLERGFGEKEEDYLVLSPLEALYLSEVKKIKVKEGRNVFSFEKLLEIFKKLDKNILMKYFVYSDLRKNGYIVRTGLKYGSYFRVYEKGIRVGEGHSHWLVQPISENWKTSIYEIARAIRLAHSVRKKMIWAVVDSEGDITYYKIERILP